MVVQRYSVLVQHSLLLVAMPPRSARQPGVSAESGRGSHGVPEDDLKSWHQQYTAQDGGSLWAEKAVIRAVKSDVLDDEQIESEVQQLIPATDVAGGFCSKCRHLLDNWPALMFPDMRDHAVGRHFYINELEAAARLGCRFCALLLSRLEYTHLLDAFRKIEARLRDVGDSGTASLSIAEHEEMAPYNSQALWLNFPGKIASHASQPSATKVTLSSYILPPTGEPARSYPFH